MKVKELFETAKDENQLHDVISKKKEQISDIQKKIILLLHTTKLSKEEKYKQADTLKQQENKLKKEIEDMKQNFHGNELKKKGFDPDKLKG
jgi:galactokinase/mevalonate kinase-like predicted kinase